MKKKLALTLVAALTMSVFVGCSAPAEDDTTPEDNTNVEEEVEEVEENEEEDVEDATDVTYTDGTYEGIGEGYKGDIKVSVEVADGAITNVEILEQEETEGLGDAATEEVAQKIVEENSTEVEVVSGATWSSEGTMEAVTNALEGAK